MQRAPRPTTAKEASPVVSTTSPRPVVKWAGGKGRLLAQLERHVPTGRFRVYAEPFAGGAAMFFALADGARFDRARLADKNDELVALYGAVKNDVDALVEELRGIATKFAEMTEEDRSDYFYAMRSKDTSGLGAVARAARLLFLNKTCFNGLWRVNSKGVFNVPFGRYAKPKILDEAVLRAAHTALSRAEIVNADFETILHGLGPEDFVYFDPPYMPVSKTANFTAYAAEGFGYAEQERLAKKLTELRDRGVRALLSNGDTDEMRALYTKHGLHVTTLRAARSINSDPSKRGEVTELVVTTYDVDEGFEVRLAKKARAAKTRSSR